MALCKGVQTLRWGWGATVLLLAVWGSGLMGGGQQGWSRQALRTLMRAGDTWTNEPRLFQAPFLDSRPYPACPEIRQRGWGRDQEGQGRLCGGSPSVANIRTALQRWPGVCQVWLAAGSGAGCSVKGSDWVALGGQLRRSRLAALMFLGQVTQP